MEAFKKWLKEDSIKSGLLYDEQKEEQREKGWRAALNEVLKQIDQSNSDGSIVNWIKEELKDE